MCLQCWNVCLFCGNTCRFCGNIRLVCGNVRLMCINIECMCGGVGLCCEKWMYDRRMNESRAQWHAHMNDWCAQYEGNLNVSWTLLRTCTALYTHSIMKLHMIAVLEEICRLLLPRHRSCRALLRTYRALFHTCWNMQIQRIAVHGEICRLLVPWHKVCRAHLRTYRALLYILKHGTVQDRSSRKDLYDCFRRHRVCRALLRKYTALSTNWNL